MNFHENNVIHAHIDIYTSFLQIFFTKLSPEMLCGEVQKVEVTLKNIGNAPLTNVYIASTDAKLFTLEDSEINRNEGTDLY